MKRLFLIVAIIVCYTSSILAQAIDYPCDISSTGLELRNASGSAIVASIPVNGTGNIRIPLVNIGTNPTVCAYPVGTVDVVLAFYPSSSVNNICKYNGPATFTSGKYTFTWVPEEFILVGINNQPIPGGLLNAESVLVPILGVKPGTATFLMQLQTTSNSDDVSNNSKMVTITVVGAAAGPLPLTLNSFEGSSDKCNARLKWNTSNEINVSRFEIEFSKNGLNFERAGSLNPSVTNGGNYEFNTSQESGKGYYRLKMIDRDASFTYSKIVPIVTSCSDKLVKIYPNPVKLEQLLNVNISGYNAGIKGDLYSATGQLVKSYVLKNGANPLSVENLAQGFYTLRVSENGSITETFKLNILK